LVKLKIHQFWSPLEKSSLTTSGKKHYWPPRTKSFRRPGSSTSLNVLNKSWSLQEGFMTTSLSNAPESAIYSLSAFFLQPNF